MTVTRIEPSVIEALAATLRDWGHEISDAEVEDLIDEWDRVAGKPQKPHEHQPDENQLGRWRKGGPSASRQAAIDNYPRSGSQKQLILRALLERGERGYTADELRTDYSHVLRFNTTAARLHDLEKDGWLDVLGERATSSGSKGRVYTLSAEAAQWVRSKEQAGTLPA